MKRIISLSLALLMICGTLFCFVSCDNGGANDKTTTAQSTTAAEPSTSVAPVETTAAPETTAALTTKKPETTKAPETTAPVTKEMKIGTADELFALSEQSRGTGDFAGYTITFTADIDISGKNWTPMDGASFSDTVFDGQGHTISGMTIEGNAGQTYLGFIGVTLGGVITFKDLTFSNASLTALGKECGIIVGQNNSTELIFNNVAVVDSKIDGYMDYKTNSANIAMRVAAFVGANWKLGLITIEKCAVKNFEATAFHNLAAFVGYDAVLITEVKDSTVENMKLTFSYCQSDSYTIDQDNKYIQVFYNFSKWPDTLDDALAANNTYKDVSFVDYTTGLSYDPATFRSNYKVG